MKNKEVCIGLLVCLLFVVSPVLLAVYYMPKYDIYSIITSEGVEKYYPLPYWFYSEGIYVVAFPTELLNEIKNLRMYYGLDMHPVYEFEMVEVYDDFSNWSYKAIIIKGKYFEDVRFTYIENGIEILIEKYNPGRYNFPLSDGTW